jgi:hypothetical protein
MLACYVVWHLWKERGTRVFENKSINEAGLVHLIRDDVAYCSVSLLGFLIETF